MASKREYILPSSLPILTLKKHVLLPGGSLVVHINDPKGLRLIEDCLWEEKDWHSRFIGIVPCQPGTDKMSSVGVASRISRMTAKSHPVPHFSILANGLCRFRIDGYIAREPYSVASVTQLEYSPHLGVPVVPQGLIDEFLKCSTELVDTIAPYSNTAQRLKNLFQSLPVHYLPDILVTLLGTRSEEKLKVLTAVDINERLELVTSIIRKQTMQLSLVEKRRKPLHSVGGVRGGDEGKEVEFGNDNGDDDIHELAAKIANTQLPDHARKTAEKELKRLKALPPQFPEHAVLRSYLETLLALPWSSTTTDILDIQKARTDLDSDHYGLEDVKKRILEYLAVRKLKNSLKGPILCLVGPPGVGKTSIGKSIAHTMGRKFSRLSLGGICDQSDIRGHRRTYVGAMLGRVLESVKTVGSSNPVILLDEVEKMSRGIHGDPSAALLEVLDPEQNHTFTDQYLGIPFDLSKVLFIATANSVSTIPSPLLDRMEVIKVRGYTVYEKTEIATRHLLPKLIEQHGLKNEQLTISSPVIQFIITHYTREAGVRELERMLGAVCRATAIKVVEGKNIEEFDQQSIEDILGLKKYDITLSERLITPGVAVGLAWTPSGGDILFVEACLVPGTGELVLTGQLGDVMKESAQIALDWLRSNGSNFDITCDPTGDQCDIHIHFPAGAIEKDGPSAGVTIVTVLASLYSGRCVRSDSAMTGEVTLRGLVLPVGGVKEKVLAAHRAGVSHVILPKKNEKDLKELPDNIKGDITFTLVEKISDVLEHAFEDGFPSDNNILTVAPPFSSKL